MMLIGTDDGVLDLGSGAWSERGRRIVAMVVDGDTRWALADRTTLLRAHADGPWEPVAELSDGKAHCLAVGARGVLVGASDARLLELRDGELAPVTSFGTVDGRDGWYTPWGAPADVRSIATAGDGLFVNVHVGGIPRSLDGGASWAPTIDVGADVHQVLVHDGVVYAAAAVGLARSHDEGLTWKVETDGLHASYARAVAVAGDVVLVSASDGPFTRRRAAVYRRPAGATSFERCQAGLPEWFDHNVDTGCLGAAGPTAVIGTEDGSVYLSRDAGDSWEVAIGGLPPVRCVAVA